MSIAKVERHQIKETTEMEIEIEGKYSNIHLKRLQEAISKGIAKRELEKLTAQGLQLLHVQKGFLRFNFIIPASTSDEYGNWHVGAIATIIDITGSVAIYSATECINVTMDYNISYYSSAKIHEEVEIEAKAIANKGKLTAVMVEVRRKNDGELIAIGKQWTASNNFRAPWQGFSKL